MKVRALIQGGEEHLSGTGRVYKWREGANGLENGAGTEERARKEGEGGDSSKQEQSMVLVLTTVTHARKQRRTCTASRQESKEGTDKGK